MSAKYPHVHSMALTHTQMHRLIKGESVRVSHTALSGGNIPVHLGVRDHNKVVKRVAEGSGMVMKFSPAQAKYHANGLWDSLKSVVSTAINVGKAVYSVAKPAYEAYSAVSKILGKGVGSKASRMEAEGLFGDIFSGIHQGLKAITSVTQYIPGTIGTVSKGYQMASKILGGGMPAVERHARKLYKEHLARGGALPETPANAKALGEDLVKIWLTQIEQKAGVAKVKGGKVGRMQAGIINPRLARV